MRAALLLVRVPVARRGGRGVGRNHIGKNTPWPTQAPTCSRHSTGRCGAQWRPAGEEGAGAPASDATAALLAADEFGRLAYRATSNIY